MWKLSTRIPNHCTVAVSGGADSMAALHYVAGNPSRDVFAAMFDHGTGFHDTAYPLVKQYCDDHNIPLTVGTITGEKPKGVSPEEYWRIERLKFFAQLKSQVVTGHHLGDVVETWLWGACHGQPILMAPVHENVIRPFLLVTKSELVTFCEENNVPYIDDPSNTDVKYTRNRIRHELIPVAEKVNPGISTMLRRKLMKRDGIS